MLFSCVTFHTQTFLFAFPHFMDSFSFHEAEVTRLSHFSYDFFTCRNVRLRPLPAASVVNVQKQREELNLEALCRSF